MPPSLKHQPPGEGYRPDFEWGTTVIEVKSDPHSFRSLRSGLLQLAYYLAGQPNRQGLLLLHKPRLSDGALREEWRLAERALKSDLLDRLSVAVKRGEELVVIAGKLPAGLRESVDEMVAQEARLPAARTQPAADMVFLVLLLHWFHRSGPLTTQYLMQTVGCSYPTVAAGLRRLGSWIRRESYRRVRLWGFPADQWQRVVAARDRVHPLVRYVGRTGRRRSPEALRERAAGLGRNDLAVGGVIGARHYLPSLDLRGTPRLDLTLHCPREKKVDFSFVKRLDPALERSDDSNEPAVLAIHVLRTPASFFQPSGDGLPVADEIDCLLSLHDAKLDAQARELLDHLITSVG